MEQFGFDKLPEVIRQLFEKVEHIEAMLMNIQSGNQHDDVQLLNITEAANYLNVTVPALHRRTSRRIVPFNNPGKRLYFLKSDLDQWIKSAKMNTYEEILKENKHKLRG